jgi:hypothetical protein
MYYNLFSCQLPQGSTYERQCTTQATQYPQRVADCSPADVFFGRDWPLGQKSLPRGRRRPDRDHHLLALGQGPHQDDDHRPGPQGTLQGLVTHKNPEEYNLTTPSREEMRLAMGAPRMRVLSCLPFEIHC